MTREEAIIHIGTFRAITKDITKYKGKAIDKAFDMAIKALEQEPCPNAISRSDMLDAIGHGTTYTSEDLQIIIKGLPSVNPQAKTGHWIEHPEIETSAPEYLMFYECSECGDKQCFCKPDIHRKHFCNNCGAKLVEPQESEGKE